MQESYQPELEPFGRALLSYWRGNHSAILAHESKRGIKKELPVSVFFRTRSEYFPTENVLKYYRGRVLVVSVLLAFLLSLCGWGNANAEFYKWVDKNGATHFSEFPPSDVNVDKTYDSYKNADAFMTWRFASALPIGSIM